MGRGGFGGGASSSACGASSWKLTFLGAGEGTLGGASGAEAASGAASSGSSSKSSSFAVVGDSPPV
ncbi:MAG: hypothetical protein INR71_00570 [Terriglobus roseus]|nr:hypothetical protein [Terriglobus roseus]